MRSCLTASLYAAIRTCVYFHDSPQRHYLKA